VICDPRLSERPYGRIFRASLPPMATTRSAERVVQRLRELRPDTDVAAEATRDALAHAAPAGSIATPLP
jgi:hypothetical protein